MTNKELKSKFCFSNSRIYNFLEIPLNRTEMEEDQVILFVIQHMSLEKTTKQTPVGM